MNPLGLSSEGNDPSTWGTGVKMAIHTWWRIRASIPLPLASQARTARSNGQAEAMVKRLSEHLKFYSKDDYSVEEVIPLIEMNLRAVPHSKLGISSYELVFGRPMPLGIPGNPETSPEENTDRIAYYKWLSTELHRLHGELKKAKEDLKLTEKQTYDRINKVQQPKWKVCLLYTSPSPRD